MVYSPKRKLGRFVLAACAVSLGVASLGAQTPSTAAPTGVNPSRFDVFTGYSYFGAHGQLKPLGVNYNSIDLGAIGSGAYYFNKWFGGELIFSAHPDGKNDGLYAITAGPIFRAPMQNFTLFAHGAAGAARLVGPNSYHSFQYHNPWTWGPTLTVGGGMDYDLPFFNNRFSFRLFQADFRYVHANFGPFVPPPSGPTGGRANLNGVQLSTGILTHFGNITPPPPVTFSCSASPSTAFPGDPITVTGTAANLNPKKTPTYSWTSDGGTVSGTGPTASVDTKNLNPGTYTVKGHVTQGNRPGDSADCSAQFTIQQFGPPTVSCSANPSTVAPGDSATITATGSSPQNRPLTYSFSSTAGSVTGNTSTATLNTTGAAPGTITVTANVVDDKGQTASCTATVTVVAPAPPPAPTTQALCSISFDRDKRRPTRVDNEAKACLDEVALNMQRTSDAKLAIAGNAASTEKNGTKLAAARAVNTKDYLVKEKGIDASRISVFTGSQDGKTVNQTLIPTGATLDQTGLTPVDESAVKVVPRTAPARRARKK
jgi:outer membrane protein OmpA-like peptidoglycan-associated protein